MNICTNVAHIIYSCTSIIVIIYSCINLSIHKQINAEEENKINVNTVRVVAIVIIPWRLRQIAQTLPLTAASTLSQPKPVHSCRYKGV